ncbi:unnamed protein product, partial [marine sediment metagenome]
DEWDTSESCWEDLLNSYLAADNWRLTARELWLESVTAWNLPTPDIHEFQRQLLNSVDALNNSISYLVSRNTPYAPDFGILYWVDNFVKAEVTWKSICEAWVKDDFEGRFWTIGIIDRMRQIMWDEPFDLTWAARPEEKEI